MDTLLNLKAFLATAGTGGFSAAGRHLGLAPSVVAKRVDQLEARVRAKLFERTTRSVVLTEAGEHLVPRLRPLLHELEELLTGVSGAGAGLIGAIRIKVPAPLGVNFLAHTFAQFQHAHPGVSLDIVTLDRSVNPIEAGFDIAIGALPELYDNVVEEPLCPYPRVVCASPGYLARHGTPATPLDLVQHQCLVFGPTGSSWVFEGPRGASTVEVKSRFTANNSHILMALAREGNGIAILARSLVDQALAAGELIPILDDYPVPELWVRALVPRKRIHVPRIAALVEWMKTSLAAGA